MESTHAIIGSRNRAARVSVFAGLAGALCFATGIVLFATTSSYDFVTSSFFEQYRTFLLIVIAALIIAAQPGAIIALTSGIVSLRQYRSDKKKDGKSLSMAIVGLVLGIITSLPWVFIFVFFLLFIFFRTFITPPHA